MANRKRKSFGLGSVSASVDTGITARGTRTGLQRKVSDVSGKSIHFLKRRVKGTFAFLVLGWACEGSVRLWCLQRKLSDVSG